MNIEVGDIFYWESSLGDAYHKIEILELIDGFFEDEVEFETIECHNNRSVGNIDRMMARTLHEDYEKIDDTEYGKQKRELNI